MGVFGTGGNDGHERQGQEGSTMRDTIETHFPPFLANGCRSCRVDVLISGSARVREESTTYRGPSTRHPLTKWQATWGDSVV